MIERRIAALDWAQIATGLDARGWETVSGLLERNVCSALAERYADESAFRSRVVIFAVSHRPVTGARGVYRVNMRQRVSRLRSGTRYTLGVIFHDAE